VTTFVPGWDALPGPLLDFWTERHLATLTTLRPDGRPHVVPVGATLDPERGCAWVITNAGSRKTRNLAANPLLSICQVDGGRWSTIEGRGTLHDDPETVARAVERYAGRYRQPRENPTRIAVRIDVDRFVFGPGLLRPTP
jgi:PPOX class probable F420-dependent enzyme